MCCLSALSLACNLPGAQNEVLQAALRRCGYVAAMASEEDDAVIMVERSANGAAPAYVAVFDPLDGSRNIDASIPTGTIFGLYRSSGAAGMRRALAWKLGTVSALKQILQTTQVSWG